MVNMMAVDGASDLVADGIRQMLPLEFPVSSFDLDLEQMRETVVSLPGEIGAALCAAGQCASG